MRQSTVCPILPSAHLRRQGASRFFRTAYWSALPRSSRATTPPNKSCGEHIRFPVRCSFATLRICELRVYELSVNHVVSGANPSAEQGATSKAGQQAAVNLVSQSEAVRPLLSTRAKTKTPAAGNPFCLERLTLYLFL